MTRDELRSAVLEHMERYSRDSRGPDIATFIAAGGPCAGLSRNHVRREVNLLVEEGLLSRHQCHGAWHYRLERSR